MAHDVSGMMLNDDGTIDFGSAEQHQAFEKALVGSLGAQNIVRMLVHAIGELEMDKQEWWRKIMIEVGVDPKVHSITYDWVKRELRRKEYS